MDVLNLIEAKSFGQVIQEFDSGRFISNEKICNSINSLKKETIGEGVYGKIYKVDIGNKQYAIKQIRVDDFKNFRNTSINDIAKTLNINSNILSYLNEGNTKIIAVPQFMMKCLVTKDNRITYGNRGLDVTGVSLDKGDYVCDTITTEYLIGHFLADLRRKGKSPHFIDVFDIITCNNFVGKCLLCKKGEENICPTCTKMLLEGYNICPTCFNKLNDYGECLCINKQLQNKKIPIESLKQIYAKDLEETNRINKTNNVHDNIVYTFMEYIKIIPLRDLPNTDEYIGIFVSMFHSLHLMQKYKIIHNDLHTKNIFIELITDTTMYNEKRLIDYDYFEYKYDNKSLYIPRPSYITRIGDFGYSCKFSSPKILNKDIVNYEFDDIPPFYSVCYDYIVYLDFFMDEVNSKLAKKLIEYSLHISYDEFRETISSKEYPGRIRPKYLKHFTKTPADMLDFVCFDVLRKKPLGNILLIATDE